MATSAESLKLEESWKAVLGDEFFKPHMLALKEFLRGEYEQGKVIYPKGHEYFAALNLTPFAATKVVILGQDPYHGPDQAHGLCFSVRPGVPPPPSLLNIYKELQSDLGIKPPNHGFLEAWARQGVLLLNSVLTVQQSCAGSHANKGWEQFTDRIIALLNERREHLVFVLWGAYAQRKGQLIDRGRHLVLTSAHPSPFSADRGFFGSRPFSRINAYLTQHNLASIDWRLPDLEEADVQVQAFSDADVAPDRRAVSLPAPHAQVHSNAAGPLNRIGADGAHVADAWYAPAPEMV